MTVIQSIEAPRIAAIAPERACRGVTPRVVALSLILAMVFGYVIPTVDYKLENTFLGAMHLPPAAVGVLFVLVLFVNPFLRLISRRNSLSRNEALTVYICCLFSAIVPGHGSENFIVPNLLAPFYFATRENRWLGFLQPYLKPWLTPALTPDGQYNAALVKGWYEGIDKSAPIPWGAWLVPLLFWTGFVLISYILFGCLAVILRAQWGESEALAFPLLRLPLEMTDNLDDRQDTAIFNRFLRNPVMWCGFGVAVAIQALRGLHIYFPDVPNFPLELNSGALFSEPPWNQMGWVNISVYPIAVGITYLLTSEVSFSLWFFFWFIKFQDIVAYYLGFPPGTLPGGEGLPDKAFTSYQIGGCYLAYVGIMLWTARKHIWHVAQRGFGRLPATAAERTEALSYPVAFWGFVLSFAAMVGATCVAGVRLDIALALWICYLIFAIGLSRVAIEGGMLALQHQTLPLGALANLIGNGPGRWLTPANGVVPASMFQSGMVFHMRGFIMPSFLHSFKLAHDRRIAAKPLMVLISVVVLISVAVSWITVVRMGYRGDGALGFGHSWWAQTGPQAMPNFVVGLTRGSNPSSTYANWTWLVVGALFTLGMMSARSRFIYFPFHPIGYMMSLTYPAQTFWASIFLGWLAKTIINRFGGNDSYRKMTPFFLGLALGDVAMMLLWLSVDGWQGHMRHMLLPG